MKGNIQYLDHWGSDLTIVNAARVSRGKQKECLDEADIRLIRYLVQHNHTTPFRHVGLTVRVQVPIFVERQWFKHQVGTTANSISGRYVEYPPDYWAPTYFRKANPSVKQGSYQTQVEDNERALELYRQASDMCVATYHTLVNDFGVCREQARAVLGLNTMTEFIFTASLLAWHNFYVQRSASDAQEEIREYAYEVGRLIEQHFPYSWLALIEKGDYYGKA